MLGWKEHCLLKQHWAQSSKLWFYWLNSSRCGHWKYQNYGTNWRANQHAPSLWRFLCCRLLIQLISPCSTLCNKQSLHLYASMTSGLISRQTTVNTYLRSGRPHRGIFNNVFQWIKERVGRLDLLDKICLCIPRRYGAFSARWLAISEMPNQEFVFR